MSLLPLSLLRILSIEVRDALVPSSSIRLRFRGVTGRRCRQEDARTAASRLTGRWDRSSSTVASPSTIRSALGASTTLPDVEIMMVPARLVGIPGWMPWVSRIYSRPPPYSALIKALQHPALKVQIRGVGVNLVGTYLPSPTAPAIRCTGAKSGGVYRYLSY